MRSCIYQKVCQVVFRIGNANALFVEWQIGAVGLLVFTCAFGLLGSFLSISGLCASTLPTRIYYYHSAAEVYFICGLWQ